MKELVIISGKGGTGKTSITAALAALYKDSILVDCDVDAADLHLVLNPEIEEKIEFYSGKTAEIVSNKCIECGKCIELCKFDAIKNDLIVNPLKCEGCGVCAEFCPVGAINFDDNHCGEWYVSNTRFGKMIHAKLGIAEENSGKLVTTIRNRARLTAKRENAELILVDGSPGIGCPVIASISGASMVLIVTEPTMSGLHDLERIYKLTQHFKIKACVCINKADINTEVSEKIEEFCVKENVSMLGKISYNKDFTNAQIKRLTVMELEESSASKEIEDLFTKINAVLAKEK